MTIEKYFRDFLTEYYEGIRKEEIPEQYKIFGLCYNFKLYLRLKNQDEMASDVYVFTHKIFESDGLDKNYPFYLNDDGLKSFEFYKEESVQNKMHLNPKRIAWVKHYLEKG